jgi:Aberrant zinc-finger
MDKHDRPYKCMEPGCDKIQGFTYSGGLLRHQREVHKKNSTAKKPLMCPYADCNRSTGSGFTRQENLKEHLRRRHMHSENGNSPELSVLTVADVEGLKSTFLDPTPSLKRKHDGTEATLDDVVDDGDNVDLHNELKRLRREVEEKDRRLEELEKIVAGLQQSIPHHGIPVVATGEL